VKIAFFDNKVGAGWVAGWVAGWLLF